MSNLSPVDHLGFKTLHAGSWITSKDTGKLVVQLGENSFHGSAFFMLHHNQTACNLVWSDSHDKDHVLLLPDLLHILGACPEGSLVAVLLCPFPNSCWPSTENAWEPGGGREHGEAMDPHGFSLVGTCLTRTGESVLRSNSAMQGCRMTLPPPWHMPPCLERSRILLAPGITRPAAHVFTFLLDLSLECQKPLSPFSEPN